MSITSVTTAEIKDNGFADIVFFGLRATIGVIFIAHSLSKFNPSFGGFLDGIGMPPEAQIPIALLELVGGAVLIVGVLSRVSAAMLL